ncbi:pyrolysin [Colletotrichum limetticola]|uniref:Pyrolysin n=1 Tax=Colletotrichum limetticola TaxID=1209924 RepID=A0ABQ9Q195_9PEZI|nr:pyrolysin [Colletotrichum limetticola]
MGNKENGQCWQVLDTNLFGTSVKLAFYYIFQDAAWEIPNRNVYNPKEQPLGFGLTSLEDGKWLVQQNERGHKNFNIAGVAALYFSANGGRSKISSNAGDSAHHLIASSGKPSTPLKVITYKTSITPAVINLNDTDHSTISTEPASDPVVAFPPIPYSSNEGEVATVKFSATALDVALGTTGVLTVTFIEPAGIDAKLFPIYGGYINIIGFNDESLRVTCAENDTFKMTIEDTFTIDFDILWPRCEFSFDHYNLILDAYFDAPVQQYPRLPSSTWWPSGNFSHGSAIESGEYKILSRALRT